MPSALVLLRLVKKLIVIGIMEKIHGVNIASSPLPRLIKNSTSKGLCSSPLLLSLFFTAFDIADTFDEAVSLTDPAFALALFLLNESIFPAGVAVAVVVETSVLLPASITFIVKDFVLGGRHISSLHIW